MSPLCLGGMSIGEAWTSIMGSMNKEDSFKLLDAFWEAGGNFIDTANNYWNEESETRIGEWVAERGIRDLAGHRHEVYLRLRLYAGAQWQRYRCGNSRKSIHMSVRESLRKPTDGSTSTSCTCTGGDYTTSIKEIMDSLHILVEEGTSRYTSVSSDTPAWVVSAANTYAVDHGKTPSAFTRGSGT